MVLNEKCRLPSFENGVKIKDHCSVNFPNNEEEEDNSSPSQNVPFQDSTNFTTLTLLHVTITQYFSYLFLFFFFLHNLY